MKVACEFCVSKFFRKKLGRCLQCMAINLILLVAVIGIYFFVDIGHWLVVQQVALYMLMLALGALMAAHGVAWCFYQYKGRFK